MKLEYIHKIAPVLFFLLLFASCGKEEFADIPAGGNDEKIRFDISVNPAKAIPSGGQTRVSTDSEYGSTFTDGDQVGVFIVKESDGGLRSKGNWVDNMKMTYSNGSWNYSLPTGKKYYPRDGSKLSFYAYSPYMDTVDPLAIIFSVKSDQSSGLSSSYLMTASKTEVSRSHEPVSLSFSHRLAMVKINLINGEGPENIAPGPADVAMLNSRKLKTTLNLAEGTVGEAEEGEAIGIKMFHNTDKCWYALIPAQTLSGKKILSFEWDRVVSLNVKFTSGGIQLKSGQVKPLDITIAANVKADSAYIYRVGDAYPYLSFDKKGVVIEMDGDEPSKIIGLKRGEGLAWSINGASAGATDLHNGLKNMAAVRAIDGGFDNHPAFKWVHELNPGVTTYEENSKNIWYLPGSKEIESIFTDPVKDEIVKTFKALGLENPFQYAPDKCWSSTKVSGAGAKAYSDDGSVSEEGASSELLVWPIMVLTYNGKPHFYPNLSQSRKFLLPLQP